MDMNLKQQFILFLEQRRKEGKYRRQLSFISSLLNENILTVQLIEENLRKMKTGKENMYQLVMDFYAYCQNRGICIETDLHQKIAVDDPSQRRIAMIKYLQNHTCTTSQLADVFMLDERTVRNDLLLLEQGIPVKAKIIHEGWKHSMNPSMHPIFLTLDLNEIIAMTIGLVQCASLQPLFQQQYLSIARNIYNQLSDYAKGRIAHMIEMNDIQDYFLKDMSDEYRRNINDSIITMAKRDIPGRIMVSINDTDYVYNNCHIQSYDHGICILTEQKRTVTLDLDSIVSCQYDK